MSLAGLPAIALMDDGSPAPGRAAVRRRRRQWRQRVAVALIAYGVAGIVLAGLSLAALAGPVSALDALGSRRADAVRWLDLTLTSLGDVQQASAGGARSLAGAESSARRAASLFRELAAAMTGLREASTITILGTQPLGGVTDDLDRVADQAGPLADELAALSTALAAEVVTLDRLGADAGRLHEEVGAFRESFQSADVAAVAGLRGLAGLLVLLVAWLVLPAIASLAVGIRLLRGWPASDGRSGREATGAV